MDNEQYSRQYTWFDDVIFTKRADGQPIPEHLTNPKLNPEKLVLEKGFQLSEEWRPTICDMIVERDVSFKLRDGIKLYADLFRPTDESRTYPVILVYTPYGKTFSLPNYDVFPGRANMRKHMSCGLDTFEGPEPDYWVKNEFIVAVVDARGMSHSEGEARFWGYEESLDIFDTVEWLGAQSWSSGKIGMAGNSWLAINQFFTAALKPPHLTAIAPWEGGCDLYRDSNCRGGIPSAEFSSGIGNMLRAHNGLESDYLMTLKYPFFNDYWGKEKRPDFDNLDLPMYVVASWSSNVHGYGTLRAYCSAPSKNKWLRVHNTQEWPDQQTPKYRDELRDFFDYFLKGIENGWSKTPRVRVSLLDPMGTDVVDRPYPQFPIPETEYRKLYLDSENIKLSGQPVSKEGSITYEVGADKDGQVKLRLTFVEDTEFCGYAKLHFFVSTDKGSDIDLFAYIYKEDSAGIPDFPVVLGVDYMGAEARLRVSHRKIENTDPWDWRHEHKEEELIAPGQIVEIETIFWPLGMVWRKGETLVLTVSACELQKFEFPLPRIQTRNEGRHTILTGGKYDSYIEIPLIR